MAKKRKVELWIWDLGFGVWNLDFNLILLYGSFGFCSVITLTLSTK